MRWLIVVITGVAGGICLAGISAASGVSYWWLAPTFLLGDLVGTTREAFIRLTATGKIR